jgi:hypothetical protein
MLNPAYFSESFAPRRDAVLKNKKARAVHSGRGQAPQTNGLTFNRPRTLPTRSRSNREIFDAHPTDETPANRAFLAGGLEGRVP